MEKYIDRREEKDRREKSNGCTLRMDSFATYAYSCIGYRNPHLSRIINNNNNNKINGNGVYFL